jgi:endonuclease/exonuclease/phosphatase (EEP) superfamily protein YafD
MKNFFIILALLSIIFTLIKLIRKDHWSIRLFDFPQVQIVFLDTLALIGLLVVTEGFSLWEYVLAFVLLTCIIYEIYIIFPYTILAPKQSKSSRENLDSDRSISFMVSNVYMPNDQYHKVIEILRKTDPDILITLETNKDWENALKPIEEDYPYGHKIPLENMYGMHLYSKLELKDIRERYLIQKDVPSILCTVVLRDGTEVELYCVHPKPPSPTENSYSTSRDGELYKIAQEVKDKDFPVIVAGDLNDVAWSHSTRLFQRLSGLLDPRKGRGFFNTFNAKIPLFRWPLDHIFHSTHFRLFDITQLPSVASDHFPIYAAFTYEPEKHNGEVEPADMEDEVEAKEKIEEAEE